MFSLPTRRAIFLGVAMLITAYGGLLRLDALVQKYGTVTHPAWARVLTRDVAPRVVLIRPAEHVWSPVATPYVGGDPINYLRFAREMKTFYQPHVREPVFLALTRAFLWLLSDQDVAVSFASAAGSTLAILAVYLLGASAVSPIAGLVAALLVAGEYELTTWAVDGWRDDTFTAAVVFAAWACVRFHRQPSFGNALLVGATAGVACLTRVTALSFVLPALVLLVADAPRTEWRHRAEMAGVAFVIFAALLAPFLISCAIATGDPLFAVNYHTGFYRFGEGLPAQQPMSARAYIAQKFARRPMAAFDTTLMGLFFQPFLTKWHGFEAWMDRSGVPLSWCAVAGLLMLPFSSVGRLLLAILFASLVPYAFTWNVAAGGEWRFTMHAYPLYIVAALYALDRACRFVVTLWRDPHLLQRVAWRPALRQVLPVAAVAVLVYGLYLALPWFVVREAIDRHDDVSIETGTRDAPFFRAGWSPPHRDGVIVRVSQGERAFVRFPLPARRRYEIVLRLDPVAPELQRRVTVLLNRQLLGSPHLTWNPERMGSYRLQLPEAQVRIGANELTIIPETVVPAAAAGPRFAWLDSQQQLGVRLWYVRVLAPPPQQAAK